jgi:transcriptional regulator with XRE-family HTH domain
MPNKKTTLTPFGRYLKKNNISAADAASELGVTRSYVQALMTGAMTPGLKLAIEILHWSRETVSAESWVKS